MHKIRIHILQALNRDTRKLYDVQQVNARLQAIREQRTEQVINHQLMRRTLSKMKNILEALTEGDEERAAKGTEKEKERTRKGAGNRRS
jgi:predicted transposase YdaD